MEELIKLALYVLPAEIIGIAIIQKLKPMFKKAWAVNLFSIIMLGFLGFFISLAIFNQSIALSILGGLIAIGGAETIYQQLSLKSLEQIKEEEPIEIEDIIEIER